MVVGEVPLSSAEVLRLVLCVVVVLNGAHIPLFIARITGSCRIGASILQHSATVGSACSVDSLCPGSRLPYFGDYPQLACTRRVFLSLNDDRWAYVCIEVLRGVIEIKV